MAFISRLIQGAGWLWIATGIASQLFDFGDISWFPGIILIFISRVMRTQVSRRPQTDQPEQPDKPARRASVGEIPASTVPERPLNTERRTEPPPQFEPGPPPPKPIEVKKPPVVVEPVEPAEPVAVEPELAETPKLELEPSERTIKSSDEMIAEARRRWDRRR